MAIMQEFEVWDDDDNDVIITLPMTMAVCPMCGGSGAIPDRRCSPTGDGSWTASERAEFYADDADFAESYFSGSAYSQKCEECDGRNVIAVVDESRADADDLAMYRKVQTEQYDADRIMRAECGYMY